jgi:hypothetical protein
MNDLFFWIAAVVLVIGGIWLIACGLSSDEPDDPMDEPHGDWPHRYRNPENGE